VVKSTSQKQWNTILYELSKAIKATCQARDTEHTLKNVLTESDLLRIIFKMNRREI